MAAPGVCNDEGETADCSVQRLLSNVRDSLGNSKMMLKPWVKPVRTPVAILGSLGVCIYVPASRHWLISYSPIHLT